MIFKYMDLTTGHMTEKDNSLLTEHCKTEGELPIRVIPHEYGYWINISSDELKNDFYSFIKSLINIGFSVDFIRTYEYAYKNNCAWINFDQDADIDKNLNLNIW